MHGHRHLVAKGLGQDRRVLPVVRDRGPSGGNAVPQDGEKRIGSRRREPMGGIGTNRFLQLLGGWNRRPVFGDEPTERPSVALVAQAAGQEGEVDVAAGLVPRAERSGGDVGTNALGRAAQPGVFPVMNRPRPIGGQVGDPASLHHPPENSRCAVAQQVRAIDQDHPCSVLPCLENLCGALADLVEDEFRTGRGGRIGREQDVFDAGQAVALDQGAHVEAAEIQRHGVHRPRINSRRGAASRKSGITTSAPTPESRSRFHSSIRPEPLLASSLATATARPPASLVFSIST